MSAAAPRKKRFGIAPAITQSVAALLDAQIDDAATSIEWIPVARIRLDPGQPRKLHLNPENPAHVDDDDPDRERKLHEIEKLKELAASIESQGLAQAISVYRHGNDYRLAMGERRLLAHRLLGRDAIRAEMLPSKPAHLRAKQLIENVQRRDLSLPERLNALKELRTEDKAIAGAEDLCTLLGLGRTVAYAYWAVLNGPQDILDAVEQGQVTSLRSASRLASMEDAAARAQAIARVVAGEQLQEAIDAPPTAVAKPAPRPAGRGAGRPPTAISLGRTKSTSVARYVVEHLVPPADFKEHYASVDWNDMRVAADVLKQVIKKIEQDLEDAH